MQEFIDTRGFFVRHGRLRRAAVLPVAPSSDVDVAAESIASHVIEDSELNEHQRHRRAADHSDDDNKV